MRLSLEETGAPLQVDLVIVNFVNHKVNFDYNSNLYVYMYIHIYIYVFSNSCILGILAIGVRKKERKKEQSALKL